MLETNIKVMYSLTANCNANAHLCALGVFFDIVLILLLLYVSPLLSYQSY